MTGGIAKPYLASYMGGKVDVKLNDGRCPVEDSEMFYYFRTSRKASECGTERRVSRLMEVIKRHLIRFCGGICMAALKTWEHKYKYIFCHYSNFAQDSEEPSITIKRSHRYAPGIFISPFTSVHFYISTLPKLLAPQAC